MTDFIMQIEQFIEQIFPTQDVKKLTDADKAKAQQQEANSMETKETLILMSAVLIVLFLVGGLMVGHPVKRLSMLNLLPLTFLQIGAAWFMGARYDGLAEKLSVSKLFQATTPQPGGPPAVGHAEL